MKSLMEETKVVQTLTILLYSRTYQSLYIEIFDTQTKNLLSKHNINTSQHEEIHLGMALKQFQIMVKKNQQNLQILDDFKFCYDDFSNNSTVQELENYVKLKKKFPQYSLLFQIFYRNRSTVNSMVDLDRNSSVKIERDSQELRKNAQNKQLKQIARSNLFLLQYRVVNNYQRNLVLKKNSLGQQDSLQQKSFFERKGKKTQTLIPKTFKSKKDDLKKSYTYLGQEKRFNRIKSLKSLKIFKKSSQIEEEQISPDISTIRDSSQNVEPVQLIIRSQKKTLTYDGPIKVKPLRKKITFMDEIVICRDQCIEKTSQTKNSWKNSIIREKSQTGDQSLESVPKIQRKQESRKKTLFKKVSHQTTLKHIDTDNQQPPIQQEQPPQVQCQPIKSQQLYEQLKTLCQQKKNQRIKIFKRPVTSKLKPYTPQISRVMLYSHDNKKNLDFSQQNIFKRKSPRTSANFRTLKSDSRGPFYEKLYSKTLKSMQRQNKILNYVKTHCQTEDLITPLNLKKSTVKISPVSKIVYQPSPEMIKKIKIFNLKKQKAQEQYLLKIRSCTKTNIKKTSLRS